MDARVFEIYKPLYVIPFPYKYLIGVGFFFYIRYSFRKKVPSKPSKNELLLFLPALIYGLLHVYWFYISAQENSYEIILKVIQTDFFRINEFVYFFFTLTLLFWGLLFLQKKRNTWREHSRKLKHIKWLILFSQVFIALWLIDLCIYTIDLLLHKGQESMLFYYPNLILNSAFIYWIGYIGYMKPRLLLSEIVEMDTVQLDPKSEIVESQLQELMKTKKVYTQLHISLGQVAEMLEISKNELSQHINNYYKMNFSEYINLLRVEKVKELIASNNGRYTLLALAEQAGFSSKSSFNSIFKKMEGITPSQYKKRGNYT